MIEMMARPLPRCQDAVDALYRRITAGRVRVLGNATATGLTGRTNDLTPDELSILEAVMGDRYSARMADIWMRDALDASGVSEDDWALACEIAYHAIRCGLTDGALTLTVERIMRAGPYREKWDDARSSVSWLTQTVANAVATVQKRLAEQPILRIVHDELDEDERPADETVEQKIIRLERENRQLRATNAVQQTIIRCERAEKEDAVETVRRIGDVLAIPSKQLMPAAKLVTIATILETHSRTSRGQAKLPLDALVDRTGLSKNAVATHIQDLAAREGSPISRRVTRDWVTDDYGEQRPISVSLVSPHHDTVNESFAAVLTMGGPSGKAQKRAAAARERTAQWGRCSTHDNDLVAIKGYCPECAEVVGERVMRMAEFDDLNPIVCDSAPDTAPVRGTVTKDHNLCDSDAPHVSLLDDAATRLPWRCHCGSYERFPKHPAPGDPWRCDGCGERSTIAVVGRASG